MNEYDKLRKIFNIMLHLKLMDVHFHFVTNFKGVKGIWKFFMWRDRTGMNELSFTSDSISCDLMIETLEKEIGITGSQEWKKGKFLSHLD